MEKNISRAAAHAQDISSRLFLYISLASWHGLVGVMAGFIWCTGMDYSGMWQGLLAWMVTRDARGAYRSWNDITGAL